MIDYVPRWRRGGGHWMTIYCWGRTREFPGLPVAEERLYQGRQVTMYSYRFGRHLIWGATARILKQFLDLLIV